MKLRVKFKDGLETWIDYDCPKDRDGTEYIPLEFMTGRPDRIENVLVRSDPLRNQYGRKFPLYVEVDNLNKRDEGDAFDEARDAEIDERIRKAEAKVDMRQKDE